MDKSKQVWIVALCAFIIILTIIAIYRYERLSDSDRQNTTASQLDPTSQVIAGAYVKTLLGNVLPLKTYRGKWLLLNFWATWCGPCRMEMPDLNALWNSQHLAGLDILGVSAENPVDISAFLLNNPEEIQYPIAQDPARMLSDALNLDAIPRTLIVNPKGQVVADMSGAQTLDEFMQALTKAGFHPEKPGATKKTSVKVNKPQK